MVKSVDANRSITYARNPDYWAKDLPPQRGHHNFDVLRYDYYRDDGVALEALMAGDITLRQETSSSRWATAYDKPPVRQGLIRRTEIGDSSPRGMQGYVFNTRRALFADPKLRAALAYAYDFEWTNKTLSDGQLIRTVSYFDNSELRARGLPNPEELALLEPFRGKVPDEVFAAEYLPPKTDGSGNIRDNLRTALRLLREAGWTVKNNKLSDAKGQPLSFEILIDNPAFERSTLPFIKNLEQLGVTAKLRLLDVSQYQKRVEAYDFDMVVGIFPQSSSPGNEQRDFFSSAAADIPGGRNLAGIKDPAIDALVEQIIQAPSREALVTRVRALDRLLRWGHYVIPQFYGRTTRYAHWDYYSRTGIETLQRESFDRWWWDAEKAAATQGKRGG
jgi:microcin C transport system substrate-binding protein